MQDDTQTNHLEIYDTLNNQLYWAIGNFFQRSSGFNKEHTKIALY